MKNKFLLLLLNNIFGFNILNNIEIKSPKYLSLCNNIDSKLYESIYYIQDNVADFYINDYYSSGIICNININNNNIYGYTTILKNKKTNIYINNKLLYYENNLYNVVLHEILHSMGLDHSDKPGIMNYSLKLNNNVIINDNHKLWLSKDDLNGLIYLNYNILY
jgi:predicted Zn-dependent protease